MAADYVVIAKANRPQLGTQAIGLANRLLEVMQLTEALLDIASRQWDAGPDYTKLKAQFGLASDADAGAFLTMLTNLNVILNTNGTVAGQTRLDQLKEYVARLAAQ